MHKTKLSGTDGNRENFVVETLVRDKVSIGRCRPAWLCPGYVGGEGARRCSESEDAYLPQKSGECINAGHRRRRQESPRRRFGMCIYERSTLMRRGGAWVWSELQSSAFIPAHNADLCECYILDYLVYLKSCARSVADRQTDADTSDVVTTSSNQQDSSCSFEVVNR